MIEFIRSGSLAAAALGLLAAAPLQAGAPIGTKNVDNWQISRSKEGACMMTATFDDDSETGVVLALVWHKDKRELGFLAASKHWNKLIAAEGNPTELHLQFDDTVSNPLWIFQNARFQTIGRGTEAVMGVWGPDHSEDLAEAVTGSDNIAIAVGETDLGSFDISGAQPAYRALLRCGERG